MGYRLQMAPSAERSLMRLPEYAAAAIVEFVTGSLLESPERLGHPLTFELDGYGSARRGAYRVVCRADGDVVRVVRIDHRADVYRPR